MPPSLWVKTKGTSKKGFDKAWHALDKLGDPVNRLSNRVGAEAFWPMTTDKESDKAARILRSFCKDGFYADNETDRQSSESVINKDTGKIDKPQGKQRVLKKIPTKVIQQAKGLAIFTTMRTGLWLSGSGGSGVLLARIPETGEWSPPSGIMLHTAGVGFLAGIDIYDCVVVINTYEALEAFKKVRCTLGGEVSASAGPVGMGGVLESEVHKRQAPIWTYMKSRGLYAGVQVDGTIIIERADENERFYGERISVTDILAGKARHPPASIQPLLQTIKAAQGDMDVNEDLLPPPGETPGDVELEPTPAFGIPDPEDPDPFGVKALEAEGLFIREAGSRARPSHDVFEFKPNPNSPVYATFRRSMESSQRNSWRTSVQSYVSQDRGTQTFDEPSTAPTSLSRASSPSNRDYSEPKDSIPSDNEGHWETVIPEHHEANFRSQDKSVQEHLIDDEDFEVHEVSSARISRPDSATGSPVSAEPPAMLGEPMRQSPTFTRARLVTIPKRQPPSLPPRNPYRASTSTSTPASPIPWASSDDNRSVTSISTRASFGGAAAATDSAKKDSSAGASSVDEASESHKASGSKDDEFHSVSSAGSSESGPEKETGAQDEHSRSATPEDKHDAAPIEEKAAEGDSIQEKTTEGNFTEEKITDEEDKNLPQDKVSPAATHS